MKTGIKKICAVVSFLLAICMFLTSCGSEESGKSTKASAGSDVTEVNDGELGDLEKTGDVAYVLVYNPQMFDENIDDNDTLFTGDFGNQIDVDIDRAGETLEDVTLYTMPQQITKTPKLNPETSRAEKKFTPYKEGDTATFNVSLSNEDRAPEEFECIATGKYANAWIIKGSKDASKKDAQEVIDNFDKDIYPTDTKLFGEARFADNGHKVNILFHEMNSNYAGYFMPLDLLSKDDGVSKAEEQEYLPNYEHAIIHVNNLCIGRSDLEESLNSTVAHEFQHLICSSGGIEKGNFMGTSTWLNEAMSGFVEEYMYPGIQKRDGRYKLLHQSKLIKYGQSLYSFYTEGRDFGVYGSVFLFSEYLYNKEGEGVFKKIHNSLRDADPDESTASVIYNSVSSSFKKKIDKSISYPKKIAKMSKEETWLSKLTLDFYLSMLKFDTSDPKEYEDIKVKKLLYDDMDGADIEGGGRILFATKNGKFTVPDDSDKGLVYIGLDKDFNVITKPTIR